MAYDIKIEERYSVISNKYIWVAVYLDEELKDQSIGVYPQESKAKLLCAIKKLEKGTGLKFKIVNE